MISVLVNDFFGLFRLIYIFNMVKLLAVFLM